MARELLTVREICREYGFPRDQLYELIRTGIVPALGGERRFLIPRRVIEDMLDAKVTEARQARDPDGRTDGLQHDGLKVLHDDRV